VIKEITVWILGIAIMFTLILCGCESKLSALSPEQTIGVTTSAGDTYNVQLAGSNLYMAIVTVAVIVSFLIMMLIRSARKSRRYKEILNA